MSEPTRPRAGKSVAKVCKIIEVEKGKRVDFYAKTFAPLCGFA
jgi:hypothetical protein